MCMNSHKVFMLIATAYILFWVLYILGTPNSFFYSRLMPMWHVIRIGTGIIWLVGIYLFRWRNSISAPWDAINFIIGLCVGGGLLLSLFLTLGVMNIATIGEYLRYSIISGLCSSPSSNKYRAILASLLCLIAQIFSDCLILLPWMRVS